MARIRTVKPDFFRHELLQELESRHPVNHPMLVFEGLWGHCDKAGRFLWRPKMLKLDILPFLPFEMEETLAILERAWLVVRYEVAGVQYGWIPTFNVHQAIGGKEAQGPEKFPEPNGEVIEKYREVTGKLPRLQEGKGRELGREGNRGESSPPVDKSQTSTATAPGNGAWWKSNDGIDRKGESLGMKAYPGESYPQFKDRIFEKIASLQAARPA